jgi:hypothetical protein
VGTNVDGAGVGGTEIGWLVASADGKGVATGVAVESGVSAGGAANEGPSPQHAENTFSD